VKSILDQDLLDRVCGNGDPEFLEFALNATITPTGFTGKPEDQLFHIWLDGRSTRCTGVSRLCRSRVLLPLPFKESLVVYDGEKLLDRAAKRRAKTNQKRAFRSHRANGAGESGMENLVLSLEIGDLAQQNRLSHMDQENQERVLSRPGHKGRDNLRISRGSPARKSAVFASLNQRSSYRSRMCFRTIKNGRPSPTVRTKSAGPVNQRANSEQG